MPPCTCNADAITRFEASAHQILAVDAATDASGSSAPMHHAAQYTVERMPEAFAETWRREERKTLKQIARGRAALPNVVMPDAMLMQASRLCIAVGADGLRGELTLMRAARAQAALLGAEVVTGDHITMVAPMALRHRLRRNVLDETGSTARIERAMEELAAAA